MALRTTLRRYAKAIAKLNGHLLALVRLHFTIVLKNNEKHSMACGITEGEWLRLYKTDDHTYSIFEAQLDPQLLDALGFDEQDYAEVDVTFGIGICDVIDTNHPHDSLLLNRCFAPLDQIITGASLSAAAEEKLIRANTPGSLAKRIKDFAGVVTGLALLV